MTQTTRPPSDRAAPAGDAALFPAPAHDLEAHSLPNGAVLLAFDLEPAPPPALLVDEPLTPAQREVVLLALEGLSNAAIARALGRSRHTVSNHLRSAYERLGVNSRAELAALVRHVPPGPRR